MSQSIENAIRICVESESMCVGSYYDSDSDSDPYGSWSESYSSSVTKVFMVDESFEAHKGLKFRTNRDVFLIPEGHDVVYVVSLLYSSGDSFGQSSGNIEVIHCTVDEQRANDLAQLIEKDNPNQIQFVDDFGRSITLCNPACGYFESIEHVSVERFVVTRG